MTKQCPFCAETIQAAAIKCRYCGETLRRSVPSTKVVGAKAHSTSKKWDSLPAKVRIPVLALGTLIGLPLAVAVLVCLRVLWDNLTQSKAPDTPVSGTTFAEFDSKFSTESQNTDAQKAQMIGEYKGKRVRWQGILENVDGDVADFQEKATTLTHDVALEVADDEKSKLAGLNKGDLVTYEGTIEDYGALIAHRLDEGRIVDSKHLGADERATWLANSQTSALKPITDNLDAK